jgi:hypothetical protein
VNIYQKDIELPLLHQRHDFPAVRSYRDFVAQIARKISAPMFRRKTGIFIDPKFVK